MEDLIKDTLLSIKEYVPKLISASETVTEYLQTENEFKALKLIVEMTEGIEWVIEALNNIQNLKKIELVDTSVISNQIVEVNQALQSRDFVLTADLFEYEVKVTLEEWLAKVDGFYHDQLEH